MKALFCKVCDRYLPITEFRRTRKWCGGCCKARGCLTRRKLPLSKRNIKERVLARERLDALIGILSPRIEFIKLTDEQVCGLNTIGDI